MDLVISNTCAAMPAWVLASPAVVMVCTPCRNVVSSFGIGAGSQRNCAMGNSCSWHGAVHHRPASTSVKRPECFTDGLMQYSHERSFLPRGPVNGDPES